MLSGLVYGAVGTEVPNASGPSILGYRTFSNMFTYIINRPPTMLQSRMFPLFSKCYLYFPYTMTLRNTIRALLLSRTLHCSQPIHTLFVM